MFRIGEFSKLAKTTAKTLRFYDEEGLLKPSVVDGSNGYRYYEAKQLLELNRIMALRQVGLSIDDIKSVMSGGSSQKLDDIYNANKSAIENEISELTDRLLRLRCLLKDSDDTPRAEYHAVLKNMPRQTVFCKRGIVPDYSDIPMFIADAMKELNQKKIEISCPAYSYIAYLDRGYRESNITVEFAAAVKPPAVHDAAVKTDSPALFACACHMGSYWSLPEAYGYLLDWIERNGYSVSGGLRECYIAGMYDTPDADKWVTEIQIPIIKISKENA